MRDDTFFPTCQPLPMGEFIMGETKHDKFSTDTERPAHRVNFTQAFAIGLSPVTLFQFRAIFATRHFLTDEDESLPIVNISWDDATAYCQALASTTGKPYRLPSEAEWEYACRAGSRTSFTSGDELQIAQANFLYSEAGEKVGCGARTVPGTYPANAFGLYDLHGNVCEWVADAWHPNYHYAPSDGSAWTDNSIDNLRVIRGGSWDYLPRLLRSAWRDCLPRATRRDNVGFRVALTLTES